MDNGTAMVYVLNNPSANRLQILSQVADGKTVILSVLLLSLLSTGLEYLHLQSVVHGDLRGVCPTCCMIGAINTASSQISLLTGTVLPGCRILGYRSSSKMSVHNCFRCPGL